MLALDMANEILFPCEWGVMTFARGVMTRKQRRLSVLLVRVPLQLFISYEMNIRAHFA